MENKDKNNNIEDLKREFYTLRDDDKDFKKWHKSKEFGKYNLKYKKVKDKYVIFYSVIDINNMAGYCVDVYIQKNDKDKYKHLYTPSSFGEGEYIKLYLSESFYRLASNNYMPTKMLRGKAIKYYNKIK